MKNWVVVSRLLSSFSNFFDFLNFLIRRKKLSGFFDSVMMFFYSVMEEEEERENWRFWIAMMIN